MSFAQDLRKGKIDKTLLTPGVGEVDLVLLLDNVYDTFNVGGMYRVGDASGVSYIYHCGQTPISPNPKIKRAAVGLDDYIKHESVPNILDKIKELKKAGYQIVSLEQTKNSQPYDKVPFSGKIALVSGNETFGVSEAVVEASDIVVELPMYVVNKSLNVVVATGIVLYQIRRCLQGDTL